MSSEIVAKQHFSTKKIDKFCCLRLLAVKQLLSLPGGDFFEAVLLLAAAGNRICRKMLFCYDFRRHVREFFGAVLELARPSEAWCFLPGGDFFEAVLLLKICRKMLFCYDFRRHVREFFGAVLELARPSEAWWKKSPPGRETPCL